MYKLYAELKHEQLFLVAPRRDTEWNIYGSVASKCSD